MKLELMFSFKRKGSSYFRDSGKQYDDDNWEIDWQINHFIIFPIIARGGDGDRNQEVQGNGVKFIRK